MKKFLLVLLSVFTFMSVMPVCADENDNDEVTKGCILEFDENGNIINLEEYQECIANLIEPMNGGDDRGPRQ